MILAALMLLQAAAQPALLPPPVVSAQPSRPTIAAGTPVRLATAGLLYSRSLRQGQRFGLEVAEDVLAGGRVVIAKGTPATGEVSSTTEKGIFGKGAKFTIEPLFIDLPGTRVMLTGQLTGEGKKQVVAAAATTLLVTSLGMFITGKSATLPAGSRLDAYVRTDVTLPPQ